MLAYVSSPLNRAHDLRIRNEELSALRRRPDCVVVRVRGDQVEVDGDLPRRNVGAAAEEEEVFLGLAEDGAPWFAARAPESASLAPLRGLMLAGIVDHGLLSILAQARSIIHWHERHGFCANCGSATAIRDAGYRRACAACGAEHFPRTDPVVIIAVTHGERILLGRQAAWAEGMYSALAGFCEPGETIEQAARREVFEEAGIRVGDIRYIASQPWPFPSSLMIGLIGEAATTEITVDTSEIQDARWFSREEARHMLTRSHPQGLHASHPYAIAHALIAAAAGL
ncbi:MAG: NAD(+) diphosphatase [Rhizobiales bacterium]|nr:NAD(+) diphosphatase [Hyphomicrobiales bacterium]